MRRNRTFRKKILRLDYAGGGKTNPFAANIIVSENDVNKVANFESEKLNTAIGDFSFEKDVVKPDITQAELVENTRNKLRKEFENQLTDSVDPRNLSDSDVYQAFLKRLTEIISSMSDWETVEIQFLGEISYEENYL